jgi:hypothetical protein
MLLMATAALPLLVSVAGRAVLVVPATTVPKFRLVGLSVTFGLTV